MCFLSLKTSNFYFLYCLIKIQYDKLFKRNWETRSQIITPEHKEDTKKEKKRTN